MLEQEVRELLARQPIFAGLDDSAIAELADKGEAVSYSMGTNVFSEGDPGDAAYLIYSGKARVLKQTGTGQQVTLAVLSRGDVFGERAIVAGEAREASVRASEDLLAVRFDGAQFRGFYDAHPELQAYFDRLASDRGLVNFLRQNTILRQVPPKQVRTVISVLEPCSFASDEVVFEQGAPGDRLYIVRRGEAKAVQRRNGRDHVLAFMGEGEYFGELALLTVEPRAATVVATRETDCLSLSREQFDDILSQVPKLKKELLAWAKEYEIDPSIREEHAPKSESTAVERRSLNYQTAEAAEAAEAVADAEQTQAASAVRPKRGLFRRYPWLRQYDETDCGAASLAMVSRYYGARLSLARLRDLANVGREGASMFSLANAAEAVGFTTRAVKSDYGNLQALDLPAIAHWAGYHYIVVYEAGPDRVVVGDPAVGLLKLSRADFEKGWTGRLLLVSPTPKLLEQDEQKTTLRRFLPLLQPYRLILFEVFLASLVLNLFGLATPVFTQTIIDKVLVHQDVEMLNLMLGGMIVVGIFSTATTLLRRYLMIHVSQKLSLRLASDLFRQVTKLPMAYFQKRKIGDILTRFADNQKVQQLITGAAINTLLDVLMVIVYLAVMFVYNAELTAVALLFIPLSIILTLSFTPMMKRNNQKVFERRAATQSNLIESIDNVAAIKASAAELHTRWKYEDLIVQRANQVFQGAKLGMAMGAFSSAIHLLSSTVTLWYGAHLVIGGAMTVGQLIAFNMLIGMVMAPIMGLVGMWQTLQDTFLSLQRLGDIYEAEPEEQEGGAGGLIRLPPLEGNVAFENVSFRYNPDDGNVLSNITFEVRPGQTFALVGRSGSGKTTLISLLQRFHRPTEGRILVDGHDIAFVSGHSLRSQLGVVLQDSTIFTGTIRENIAFADPDAPLDRIVMAAKLASAHDFITSFPLGYETVVGDIGIGLSGGQKQRLTIARALLGEPRIILFDEATSNLDTESERAIQENMAAILDQRSAIVIAHRLSTIRNADKIIVLDEGRIVEQGTHGELMERRGLYYYLHTQQLGD